MGRDRSRLVKGGVAVAVVAVGGIATATVLPAAEPAPPAASPTATAPVTEQDLAETKTLSGQLGYGQESNVLSGQSGTLTWLADVGTIVERGAPMYKVDERPVIALYGGVPSYRGIGPGSSGADVHQLEENLRALGFTGFDVDSEYTGATARAVRRWQADLGLPATGTVDRGQVAFVPDAVRISGRQGQVGGPAAGQVLSYTSSAKVITADLDAADQGLVHVGGTATIRLPDGTVADAEVAAAEPAAPNEPGAGDDEEDSAPVRLTLTVADQQILGSLDSGAPVDVDLVAELREDVLTVPVTALLALTEGGFGVEVTDEAGSRIVAVETGMFANGRVEVRAPELTAGMSVEVPSS